MVARADRGDVARLELATRRSCRRRDVRRLGRTVVVGALVCGGLVVWFVLHQAARRSGPPERIVQRCDAGFARVPFVRYGLGLMFDGQPLTERASLCGQGLYPHPRNAPRSTPHDARTYGYCRGSIEDPGTCGGHPLEIESWPLCAQAPYAGLLAGKPWLPDVVSRLTPRIAQLAPDLARELPSLGGSPPRLPPKVTAELPRLRTSPELSGAFIDLYTTDTTINVTGTDPDLQREAAAVIAIRAILHAERVYQHASIPWPSHAPPCVIHRR